MTLTDSAHLFWPAVANPFAPGALPTMDATKAYALDDGLPGTMTNAECLVTPVDGAVDPTHIAESFADLRARSRSHPSLAQYIDCMRGADRPGRVYVVQEAYSRSLISVIGDSSGRGGIVDRACLAAWLQQLVSAIAYLHAHGYAGHDFALENLHLDPTGNLKLVHFGRRALVAGAPSSPSESLNQSASSRRSDLRHRHGWSWTAMAYPPPEILFPFNDGGDTNKHRHPLLDPVRCDTWSVGLVAWHLATGRPRYLDAHTDPTAYFTALAHDLKSQSIVPRTLGDHQPNDRYESDLMHFLATCLSADPAHRPPCSELLNHPFLNPTVEYRRGGSRDQLGNLHALFAAYVAAGGNLDGVLAARSGEHPAPPVLELPRALDQVTDDDDTNQGKQPPQEQQQSQSITEFRLSVPDLTSHIPATALDHTQHVADLLLQYPQSTDSLRAWVLEHGVSDYQRPEVWAALLGVTGEARWVFARHDRRGATTPTGDDPQLEEDDELEHQLAADAQRCHAYHPYLASTTGQSSLKRLIRAYLSAHPHHRYWQSFDSVAAPFLTLFPHDPALAFACLNAFSAQHIGRYLASDNARALTAAYAGLEAAVRFLDPELASHRSAIGLAWPLFAVPYIMSACAHVLALPVTYRVWDQMLARPGKAAFSPFLLVSLLRIESVRGLIMGAQAFDDVLPKLDVPQADVTNALAEAARNADALPLSVHRSMDALMWPREELDGKAEVDHHHGGHDEAEEWAVLSISASDALALGTDARTIDLRFGSARPHGTHIPRTTFIADTAVGQIEGLLRQQRNDKRVSVVRGRSPANVASVVRRLAGWGVPGVCGLVDEEVEADANMNGDHHGPVMCACEPAAIVLGGETVIHKCTTV
ncbi:hypothetical protein BC828DRAFT_380444 [Blastocladiella britannica]|nr:hypothetical protein BC828DRAFT_380444 [Blastocladiella britannica]